MAMFSYAILQGLKLHILNPKTFMPVVTKAYVGLRKYSIRTEGSKYLVPTRICIGTCIGDKDYYYHRKIVEGNEYGIGVFAMFTQAYEQQEGIVSLK